MSTRGAIVLLSGAVLLSSGCWVELRGEVPEASTRRIERVLVASGVEVEVRLSGRGRGSVRVPRGDAPMAGRVLSRYPIAERGDEVGGGTPVLPSRGEAMEAQRHRFERRLESATEHLPDVLAASVVLASPESTELASRAVAVVLATGESSRVRGAVERLLGGALGPSVSVHVEVEELARPRDEGASAGRGSSPAGWGGRVMAWLCLVEAFTIVALLLRLRGRRMRGAE